MSSRGTIAIQKEASPLQIPEAVLVSYASFTDEVSLIASLTEGSFDGTAGALRCGVGSVGGY